MKIDFNPRTGTKKNLASFKIRFSVCVCVHVTLCPQHVWRHLCDIVSPSIDVWVLGSSSQAPVARAVYLLHSRPAPAPQQLCWQPGETSSSNFSKMLDSFQSPAAQASTSPSAKVIDTCYHTWPLNLLFFKRTRNPV